MKTTKLLFTALILSAIGCVKAPRQSCAKWEIKKYCTMKNGAPCFVRDADTVSVRVICDQSIKAGDSVLLDDYGDLQMWRKYVRQLP